MNLYVKNGWIILNKRKTGGIGGSNLRWSKNKCIEVALTCKTKKEFYLSYKGAYSSSIKNGWISEIYDIFNFKYHEKLIYYKEDCEKEALKYSTKKEFKSKNRGMYEASRRNGWHSDICNHMIHGNKKNNMAIIDNNLINKVNNNLQKTNLIKEALKIVDMLATLDVHHDEEIEDLIYQAKKLTKHKLWKI